MIDTETCMSGDICDETALPDGRFCGPHQSQLDRIREEIATRNYTKSHRNKENAIEAYCESPGCPNRPVYGTRHCPPCTGDC